MGTFAKIIFVVLVILGIMWALDIGPFDKKYQSDYYSQPYQPSFGGGGYTCGSTGCECTIKRSELDAGGLIYCSCGHMTKWHHN